MRTSRKPSVFLAAIIFSGCGGGSGSSGSHDQEAQPSASPPVSTGYFVDAPVSGLSYKTQTFSGTTDELGRFEYHNDETITFSIGATELGSAPVSELITPATLDEGSSIAGNRATNIARLLITLDADRNPENGIAIDRSMHEAFSGVSFDLSQAPEALDSLEVLEQTLSGVGRKGLVSVALARRHMVKVAQKLPLKPTNSSIRALMDHGVNYSGRQSPITLTPDNQREAAQVFWSDPDSYGLDFMSMRQWVNLQFVKELAFQYMNGHQLGEGVSVSGPVDDDGAGQVDRANLQIVFDQYQRGQWRVDGSVSLEMAKSGLDVEIGVGEEKTFHSYTSYVYDMELTDLRFTRRGQTFGMQGHIYASAAVENPDMENERWELDVVLRELNSDRFVSISPGVGWYSRYKEPFRQAYGSTHYLSLAADVLHWTHGAYQLEGGLTYSGQGGEVESAQLGFLAHMDDSDQVLGELRSIHLPDGLGIAPRVRSEVFQSAERGGQAVEVYPLGTPLMREQLSNIDPVWVFKKIRYRLTGGDGATPDLEQVTVTLPPFSADPDGDPATKTEYWWLVDSEANTRRATLSSELTLTLPLAADIEDTLCLEARTTYDGFVMNKRVAIDLEKTPGMEHEVSFDDASCRFD